MNRTPSLSILVPAYNVRHYVGDCIAAILRQLQPQHELIVIDDGSSDGTAALLAQLKAAHGGDNFTLIEQANQGISCARNRAVQEARGDYIVFIDSDDLLLDGALAGIEAAIAQWRPDAVAVDFRMWHPDQPSKNRTVRCGYAPNTPITDRDTILSVFLADRDMYVWAKIIRREIYAQLAMPLFPPGRVFEDVAVVPQLLNLCASLVYLPMAILDYRQHPVSITRAISERWCMDFAAALLPVKQQFQRHAVSAPVQLQLDVAVCYFYVAVVKNSYQLPADVGNRVRAAIKAKLLESLFNDYRAVLRAMEDGTILSNDRGSDRAHAKQIRQAISGSLAFHWKQTINRKIKLWRRMRATRALAG